MVKFASIAVAVLGLAANVDAFSSPVVTKRSSTTSSGLNLYGEPREVQIIPSVLPADFGKLGADCKALEEAGCDRIQFDVMDGNFVPNLT